MEFVFIFVEQSGVEIDETTTFFAQPFSKSSLATLFV